MKHNHQFNATKIAQEPKTLWWGYLHCNGTPQLKRWFGDHKDYTEDCEGNDFVLQVVPPFSAPSHEVAMTHLKKVLGLPS